MKLDFIDTGEAYLAEVTSEKIEIGNAQDALDIMANCGYQGAEGIIIHEINITPHFFDLKTGIAGEVLQKFSTYNMKLAIVGNFAKYPGNSLRDFIFESNKMGRINFVSSVSQATEVLAKK